MAYVVLCGWCGAFIRTQKGTIAGGEVSHGICKRCKDRLLAEHAKKTLKQGEKNA